MIDQKTQFHGNNKINQHKLLFHERFSRTILGVALADGTRDFKFQTADPR